MSWSSAGTGRRDRGGTRRATRRTALITRDALGGMAANDGPVPVRALAYAARLMREARQLPRYGITAGEPALRLSAAARSRPRGHRGGPRPRAAARGSPLGVTIHEQAGAARFIDPHTIESELPRGSARRSSSSAPVARHAGSRSRASSSPAPTATLGACPRCRRRCWWSAPARPGCRSPRCFNAFGTRVSSSRPDHES